MLPQTTTATGNKYQAHFTSKTNVIRLLFTLILSLTIRWLSRAIATQVYANLTTSSNKATSSIRTANSLVYALVVQRASGLPSMFHTVITWDSFCGLYWVFMKSPLNIFHLLVSTQTIWEWHFGCLGSTIKIHIHTNQANLCGKPFSHISHYPGAMLQPYSILLFWAGLHMQASACNFTV